VSAHIACEVVHFVTTVVFWCKIFQWYADFNWKSCRTYGPFTV